MSIVSLMRKEDLEKLKGSPTKAAEAQPESAKDHLVLGFDGECRTPENLGNEILTVLQVGLISMQLCSTVRRGERGSFWYVRECLMGKTMRQRRCGLR